MPSRYLYMPRMMGDHGRSLCCGGSKIFSYGWGFITLQRVCPVAMLDYANIAAEGASPLRTIDITIITISYQLSAISYQLSAISYQLSTTL